MEAPTSLAAQVADDRPQTSCAAAGCPTKFMSNRHLQWMSHTSCSATGFFEPQCCDICHTHLLAFPKLKAVISRANSTWSLNKLDGWLPTRPPTNAMAPCPLEGSVAEGVAQDYLPLDFFILLGWKAPCQEQICQVVQGEVILPAKETLHLPTL